MKFLILLAVVAAASAVPYFPYTEGSYGNYGYGRDHVSDKYDYRTLMTGGRDVFLDKDITLVKKDFVIFYYRYLVDLIDIFKTRFNDVLVNVDFKEYDTLTMPVYCEKMTGLVRWMMLMNIDFTKYDAHYFDMFMMCKVSDYMMFMKYYWLHFNYVDVMHKDLGFMRDIYSGFGNTDKFLYKFGDHYGKNFGGVYGDKYHGGKYFGDKYYGDKYFGDKYHGDKYFGDKFTPEHFTYGDKYHGDKYFGDKYFGDKYFGDKYHGDKYFGYKFGPKYGFEHRFTPEHFTYGDKHFGDYSRY